MSFKEQVELDNINTFMNFDEFGEMKRIKYPGFPACELLMIVDDYILDRYKDHSQRYNHFDEGIFQSRIRLFIRQGELGFVPVEDDHIEFGEVDEKGYPYRVAKVGKHMGILEIHVEANRT